MVCILEVLWIQRSFIIYLLLYKTLTLLKLIYELLIELVVLQVIDSHLRERWICSRSFITLSNLWRFTWIWETFGLYPFFFTFLVFVKETWIFSLWWLKITEMTGMYTTCTAPHVGLICINVIVKAVMFRLCLSIFHHFIFVFLSF